MTLLQRGVIQRLREAGYRSLADAANDAWSQGKRCHLPDIVHPQDTLLRADFEKADRQVRSANP